MRPPAVLVILVVRDGVQWLRHCLVSLSKQTHPRLGVLAVDNASTDGSPELLESALGSEHVIRLNRNMGFPGAVSEALKSASAREAEYVLLLHDDAMLAPEAIATLVEAAEGIEGVGVVGPKVLDWDREQVLLDIGQASDWFGYPYSPLEDGEIDQGQYDRVREVLFVSSCAMLVSRAVWTRVGLPDERLEGSNEELDFCWRARVAGFRVLMTPLAVARHREAGTLGDREGVAPRASRRRYQREKAALAGMLKNYGLLSLVWLLPLYVVQGMARLVAFMLTRRFEDAYQLLAAWGWNLAHLPGTIRRRARAQAVRQVRDRQVHRYMAPVGARLRRLGTTAAQVLLPRRAHDQGGPPVSVRARLTRFTAAHPAVSAWVAASVLGLIAYRGLLNASPLAGGALATVPQGPSGYFREFVSALRSTGLGGSQAASPALAVLGSASFLTFGDPALLQKLLVLGLPLAAAAGCYRWVRAATGEAAPAVLAGACYALSAAVLWALSEGRIPTLVFLAGLPWLVRKMSEGFDAGLRASPQRWAVGAAAGMAVLISFYPGAALAAILVALVSTGWPDTPGKVGRGWIMFGAAAAGAVALSFPFARTLAGAGGIALTDPSGLPSYPALIRLSPGPAPGAWLPALFLPMGAALAAVVVAPRFGRAAVRYGLLALVSTYLAWLAAAGRLPEVLSNPVAYIGLAAVSCATLVGMGFASILRGVSRSSFGHRQLGGAALTAVVVLGLGAQSLQVARGAWDVGSDTDPAPAYFTVRGEPGRPFRVLWLGAPGGESFVVPGGPPAGNVEAGAASVRFGVTGPDGASALDTGRPAAGIGYDVLRETVVEIVDGVTRHAGALLAPFGVRFVVARVGDIPQRVQERLSAQLDLDLVSAEGLIVLRNPKAVPLASAIDDPAWADAGLSEAASLEEVATLGRPGARALDPRGGSATSAEGYASDGDPEASLILLSDQFADGWRLQPEGGEGVDPMEAFGWAMGYMPPAGGAAYSVSYGRQSVRTFETLVLGLLWLAALWATRRPVGDG